MDLLFDGHSVIGTVRRIGEEWDAALVLGVDIIPQPGVWTSTDQVQANGHSFEYAKTTRD